MENITADFALQANNLINEGQFAQAIELCNSGLALYPNYPAAYCVLAKSYYFMEEYDLAADTIKQAGKHFPYNAAVKHTAESIANKTLILGATLATNEQENTPDITDEATADAPLEEQQTKIEEEELMQITPEDIADNISSDIELIDSIEDNSGEKDMQEEENSNENVATEDDFSAELPGSYDVMADEESEEETTAEEESENSFDEEFQLVDEEGYFPEYVHQESIADMLDADETINVASEENIASQSEDISVASAQDIDLEEDSVEESITESVPVETTVGFMPTIPQHSSSLVFETNYEKTATELLYEADFDLPKTTIEADFSSYFPQHLFIDSLNNAIKNVGFLHVGNFTSDILIVHEEPATTDNILSIAESLKDAKVSIEHEDIAEEDVEMPLIASETMAKILLKQKKYTQAQQIYELLIEEKPEKGEYFQEQLLMIQDMLQA